MHFKYCVVGTFGEHWIWQSGSHLVLAEFKFGDLNNQNVIGMYKLLQIGEICQIKISPSFPL